MPADLPDDIAALTARLEKLERRKERDRRAAHAKGLLQGICSLLKPGDIVLDCGANVGAVTLPLAATGATVHAFEPDPFAFDALRRATQHLPNIILHNAAVGLQAGTIQLMRAENFSDNPRGASVKSTVISGGRKIDETSGETLEVALVSLPDIIAEHAAASGEIAFLKMDIEGAELDILETMLQQALFDSIRLTVCETHEHKFKALRPRFKTLRDAVAEAYPITKVNLDWI
ncbi:FkbM family methyltransferase [Phaeobacter inhibens]|uniref:FkbM family methyltransferase n=1 Tax=Phaeobacter inhibens TaxID=221822 RepID=UPI000C9CC754|nr:FkbM family methyltransferase [Phaeobacter inhibens]AUQ68743.1 31-O-demethyl-FK506 methyltransferase FkbM [Phaeobacter inhibens]